MNEVLKPNWRKARIEQLDRLLEREPGAVEVRRERAALLRELDMFEDAKRDYLELLRLKPTDCGVLNDFGTLVLRAGYGSAARSLFEEAVRHHPDNPMARVNLANLLLLSGEHEAARVHFEAALRADPGHIHAHRGLGNLLAATGDAAGARRHRDLGFKKDFLVTLPFRGDGAPVRVLLLVSAAVGNTPTATLLDDRYFQASVLVSEYYDGKTPLPAHDLVFNAIGDADICGEGLRAAHAILARTRKPVINDPRAVLRTGRLTNAQRLRGLPGVIAPRMAALPRRALASVEAAEVVARNGFSFPVLARAPGFHTGHHFIRAESAQQLAAAVGEFPGEEVWLIEPLDARDGEGAFRKARVMIVDRKLYPLHLAFSRNWKVHYFTADLVGSADHRATEIPFLRDLAGFIGPRGMAGLERIAATLDLDYGGIDFAVNASGDILFFEGNATMIMVPLSAEEKWDYRRRAFDDVFAAMRTMLLDRVAAGTRDALLNSASSP